MGGTPQSDAGVRAPLRADPEQGSRIRSRLIGFRAGHALVHKRSHERWNMSAWVILHWFELGTLILLCLNLWFVSSVLNALKETNRWIAFLTRVRWDEIHGPESPTEG